MNLENLRKRNEVAVKNQQEAAREFLSDLDKEAFISGLVNRALSGKSTNTHFEELFSHWFDENIPAINRTIQDSEDVALWYVNKVNELR